MVSYTHSSSPALLSQKKAPSWRRLQKYLPRRRRPSPIPYTLPNRLPLSDRKWEIASSWMNRKMMDADG